MNHEQPDRSSEREPVKRPQVRLKTLFLVVLLLGLAMGWWVDRSRLAEQLRMRERQVKLFTLSNANAEGLSRTLQQMFRTNEALTIASDPRTNTVIAHGSAEDLAVIEATLLRLDQ